MLFRSPPDVVVPPLPPDVAAPPLPPAVEDPPLPALPEPPLEQPSAPMAATKSHDKILGPRSDADLGQPIIGGL